MEDRLVHRLHDRMTQCRYLEPVKSFVLEKQTEPPFDVDVMGEGRVALEKANKELGRTILILMKITTLYSRICLCGSVGCASDW